MLRRNGNAFQCRTGRKRICPDLCNGIGDGDRGKGSAGVESTVPNSGNGIGDRDRSKKRAPVECTVANGSNSLRNAVSCGFHSGRIDNQGFVGFSEQNAINCGKIRLVRRNGNALQFIAKCKGCSTNLHNRIRDSDGGKRCAVFKCAVPDGNNGIGDGDGSKGKAAIKCVVANRDNGIRESDGGQGKATVECRVSNGGNRIGDGDRAQGRPSER